MPNFFNFFRSRTFIATSVGLGVGMGVGGGMTYLSMGASLPANLLLGGVIGAVTLGGIAKVSSYFESCAQALYGVYNTSATWLAGVYNTSTTWLAGAYNASATWLAGAYNTSSAWITNSSQQIYGGISHILGASSDLLGRAYNASGAWFTNLSDFASSWWSDTGTLPVALNPALNPAFQQLAEVAVGQLREAADQLANRLIAQGDANNSQLANMSNNLSEAIDASLAARMNVAEQDRIVSAVPNGPTSIDNISQPAPAAPSPGTVRFDRLSLNHYSIFPGGSSQQNSENKPSAPDCPGSSFAYSLA